MSLSVLNMATPADKYRAKSFAPPAGAAGGNSAAHLRPNKPSGAAKLLGIATAPSKKLPKLRSHSTFTMDSDSDEDEPVVRRNPFRRPPSRAELAVAWLKRKIPCGHIINPRDDFRVGWDLFVVLVLLFNIIDIPLRECFRATATPLSPGDIIHLLTDIFFLCDILVQFRTGYYDDESYVDDHIEIAKRYIRGWFALDLLTSIPIVHLIYIGDTSASMVHAVRWIRFTRLLKLASHSRLVRTIAQQESKAGRWADFLVVFKFVLLISIIAHILACGWFAIALYELDQSDGYIFPGGGDRSSWLAHAIAGKGGEAIFTHRDDISLTFGYLLSLYWCFVTLATVGYGDITPVTQLEITYTCLCIMVGTMSFGYIIGNVSSLLAFDDSTRQVEDKIRSVNDYMHYRKLPPDLAKRIRDHYTYAWKRSTVYDERDILQQLPSFLRTKVALQLNADLVRSMPFFKEIGKDCLALLVTELKPLQIPPHTFIYQRGQLGREMYFLAEGAVEVIGKRNRVLCTLEKGSYFGEYAILSNKPTKRSSSVRSIDYTDLFSLNKTSFDEVLKVYPELHQKIADRVQQQQLAAAKVGSGAAAIDHVANSVAAAGGADGATFISEAGDGTPESGMSPDPNNATKPFPKKEGETGNTAANGNGNGAYDDEKDDEEEDGEGEEDLVDEDEMRKQVAAQPHLPIPHRLEEQLPIPTQVVMAASSAASTQPRSPAFRALGGSMIADVPQLDSLAAVVQQAARPSISSAASGGMIASSTATTAISSMVPRTSVSMSPSATLTTANSVSGTITPGGVTLNTTMSPSYTQHFDGTTHSHVSSSPTAAVTSSSTGATTTTSTTVGGDGLTPTHGNGITIPVTPPVVAASSSSSSSSSSITPMNAFPPSSSTASSAVSMAIHARVASVIAASGGGIANKRGSGKFGNSLTTSTPQHRPAQPSFDHFSYGDIPVASLPSSNTSIAGSATNTPLLSSSAAPLASHSSSNASDHTHGRLPHSLSHSVPLHPRHLGGVLSHDYHTQVNGSAAGAGHGHRVHDDETQHLYNSQWKAAELFCENMFSKYNAQAKEWELRQDHMEQSVATLTQAFQSIATAVARMREQREREIQQAAQPLSTTLVTSTPGTSVHVSTHVSL